jgi:cytochrome oxidase Cu insertion factor (SCO1/SenC/PrrC family)
MNDNLPSEGDLSDDDRRRAFHEELRQIPESGGGRVIGRIPKKFVQWAIVAFVVLGLGGELLEHYYGNIGLPTSSAPTTTFVTPSTIPAVATTTVPSVITADDAFIGLKPIGTAAVPTFSFTDQHGATITPATTRGKVTLITFFNKNCNDICPVVGAEITTALRDLGAKASKVAIDIVNTDPFSYGASADPLALTETGLASDANVHFLTGPLATLNAMWKASGIEIKVGATANEVAHNTLLYFVSPSSQLSAFATPFAKKSSTGIFYLSTADEHQFGQGIALEAVSLMQ